jgi:hypothetical protein
MLEESARVNSFSSAQISPAPIWQPRRAGSYVGVSSGLTPFVTRPASATAVEAAATASSMSRHMTFVALR